MPQEPLRLAGRMVPAGIPAGGGGKPDEALDPELAALPDPPRRARTLTVLVLAFAALAALLAAAGLYREISYAMASGPAAGLGDLRSASAVDLAASENRPVAGEGMLGAAGGIRYERPFVDGSFRTLPVAGRASPLDMWVEVRVPAGEENERWQAPRTFMGRLVRLDAAGPRHRGLRSAIEQATGERVPSDAWLLVDGEDPADARWAFLLGGVFLVFAAWNGVAIAKLVRRVRG